jgi:hypothetical protein
MISLTETMGNVLASVELISGDDSLFGSLNGTAAFISSQNIIREISIPRSGLRMSFL